ncbi:unnamed protein product [Strongylus vulgaris]|uniref:Uncharacterized protein n=1 Tax=Strongylus vulgaris TaxID=40348 RepID=A0A3P7IDL7_STRVU|nr:unnamed protein product [Strongylus vulgaris]
MSAVSPVSVLAEDTVDCGLEINLDDKPPFSCRSRTNEEGEGVLGSEGIFTAAGALLGSSSLTDTKIVGF